VNKLAADETSATDGERVVTAKHRNHVWHVDLTVVPTGGGLWTPWVPFALPQCWPFCWWLAVVIDHFSRKTIGFAVFRKQPTAAEVRTFLEGAMSRAKVKPKYLISDKGSQFWKCEAYEAWCESHGIKPRFGAVGKHGSIAVIERFLRTVKEGMRKIVMPLRCDDFRNELVAFVDWYNEYRPHAFLCGRTPNEVYFRRYAASRKPRIEPRSRWPRGSPCAKPQTLVAGQPGDRFTIQVDFHAGRRHLPIVSLNRAA